MSHQVAILGGGPAGLSAAQRLAELGIKEIVLIEREEALGGVPRHCGHPAFGLREFHRLLGGPAYARRLAAAASGIEIRSRTTVTAIEPGGRIRVSIRTMARAPWKPEPSCLPSGCAKRRAARGSSAATGPGA